MQMNVRRFANGGFVCSLWASVCPVHGLNRIAGKRAGPYTSPAD